MTLLVLVEPVSRDAASIPDHWQRIERHTNKSDWNSALPHVNAAIAEYPDNPDFRVTEAWVLRNLKRNREAVDSGRAALARFPESTKLKEQLSYSLCALFDEVYAGANFQKERVPAEAHEMAAEAYTLKRTAWSTVIMGNSLRIRGKVHEAVKLLEQGARQYSTEAFVRENLAFALFYAADSEFNQANNYANALTLANRGLKLKPGDDWGGRLVAWSNLRLKKYEPALVAFERMAAAKPQDKSLRETLGYAYYEYTLTLAGKKQQRELLALEPKLRSLADSPADGAKHFVAALRNISDITGDYRSLAGFLKSLAEKHPQEHYFSAMAGAVLNQLKLQLERDKNPEAAQVHEESLSYLRRAMDAYETQHPGRPRLSGLGLPVKGRVIIAAQFDGGGTHSGYEKYSYDFMHVDAANSTIKGGTRGNRNKHYYTFGQPIYAVLDGEVVNVVDSYADHAETGFVNFGQGNHLQIKHANGVMSHYAHLKQGSAKIKKGMRVRKGEQIAEIGNTGLSHAPHLHFSVVTDDWVSVFYTFEDTAFERAGQAQNGINPFEVQDILLAR